MKQNDVIVLKGFEKTARPRKVFRVSNGRIETRAIRDFYESPLKAGDYVDMYRVTRKQTVEVFPGDLIIRRAGTHEITE